MTRKGMEAPVLGLALGVVILLVVLGVIVALNTSGAYRDFLNKVPWLNKIIPDDSPDNALPPEFAGECGTICADPAFPLGSCPSTHVCKNNLCEVDTKTCKTELIGSPSGNVLHFVWMSSSSSGKMYLKISDGKPQQVPPGEDTGIYQFSAGDTLEYDVYLPLKQPCTGGITIETSDGAMDNDDNWKDKNDLVGTLKNCNPNPSEVVTDSDMTPYAYRKWYHRVIEIPSTLTGKSLTKMSLVMSGQLFGGGKWGAVYTALYDNIIIRSAKGVYKFFENADPAYMELKDCTFDCKKLTKAFVGPAAYLPSDSTQPQNNVKNAAEGEVLKLSSTGPGKWMYLKAFEVATPSPYTVKAGDIVEYDVNINTCEKDVGGIDLRSKAGPDKWRDLPYWKDIYDWKSNVWTSGTPDNGGMDLINVACNKWYHRIMPAPPGIWDKPVAIVDLVIGYDETKDRKITAYYDNLQITDGTGAVKVFYPDGIGIVLYQFDETEKDGGADGNYKTSTKLEWLPSPP